jgi:hypothetical protein
MAGAAGLVRNLAAAHASALEGRAPRRIASLGSNLLVNYFRCQGCVTFWIRGLQVSLTKTKDKVCWSGWLNL